MQVDPKPSPWPCVAMLVALLLFCLTVPRFWQSGDAAADGSADESDSIASGGDPAYGYESSAWMHSPYAALNPFAASGFHELEFELPAGSLADGNLISLCPPPTIEELIETARLGLPLQELHGELNGTDFIRSPQFEAPKVFAPESEWPTPEIVPSREPAPQRSALLTAVLLRVGRVIADYSIADALRPIASGLARLHELCAPKGPEVPQSEPEDWPAVMPELPVAAATPPVASSLRVVEPGDRLAMISPTEPEVDAPVTIPPDETPAAPRDAEPWCVPQTLLDQIERLAGHPSSAEWARSTIEQLRDVTKRERWETGDVSGLLDGLHQSAKEAEEMASRTREDRLRVELLRAHWGLARRLDCWAAVHEIRVAQQANVRIAARGSLNSLLAGETPPAAENAHTSDLSNDLEAYEQTRNPEIGRQVTGRQRELQASDSLLDRTLAEAVEQHYRNANVRIAITSELLNRLVNREHFEDRPVRERIAGASVRGRSQTTSESSIQLQPAEGRWQLQVEAQGVVNSRTLANGGRARLHTRGSTDFTAQKTIVIEPSGARLEPTIVNATSHNRLVGVTTDFDWVPLVGSLARNRAAQEYRARRPRARSEVESKVARQAMEKMDEETLAAIDRVEQEIQTRLLTPMAEFGVDLTAIELTSTEERLVARLRIAGNHQLGGHTPRPQALSDSLASLQVHESALTNAAASLGLDAMRYTAPELQAKLRERFPRLATENPVGTRHDTHFEFAYRDAVQFRIDDGRLELVLGLACVELQGRRMTDVVVHAHYAPVVDGLDAQLVRDGPLGIEGRISSTDRARLHNIFSTVLSEERRLPVLRLDRFRQSQLSGLAITQLVLEDGWIGVALGPGAPERTAERTRSLR